jgi:hypothetical protein
MKLPINLFYGISFVFLLVGCNEPTPMTEHKARVTIDIQPFADATDEQMDYVCKEIKKIYPNVELKKPIAIPTQAITRNFIYHRFLFRVALNAF